MEKLIKKLSILLLLMVLPVVFGACSSDEELPLSEVIVGKWHTYKATISYNGKKESVDVSMNSEYAALYCEVTFYEGNIAVMRGWEKGPNNTYLWGEEEYGTYTVNGNDLSIRDAEGETMNAKYYPKDNNIVLTIIVDGGYGSMATANLLFRKMK
jgi:hypothetical protein